VPGLKDGGLPAMKASSSRGDGRDLQGCEESVSERVLQAEVNDAAGMVEELGERQRPPGLRQLGQP
jgi:hypothetical protein